MNLPSCLSGGTRPHLMGSGPFPAAGSTPARRSRIQQDVIFKPRQDYGPHISNNFIHSDDPTAILESTELRWPIMRLSRAGQWTLPAVNEKPAGFRSSRFPRNSHSIT